MVRGRSISDARRRPPKALGATTAVAPARAELVHVLRVDGACHDAQIRVQTPCRDHEEHVRAVVVSGDQKPRSMHQAGLHEHVLDGRISDHMGEFAKGMECVLHFRRVVVDAHEGSARGAQLLRSRNAGLSEAAQDLMVGDVGEHFVVSPAADGVGESTLDDGGSERRREGRDDAERAYDQADSEDAGRGMTGEVVDFPVAHGGDGGHGHVQRIKPAPFGPAEGVEAGGCRRPIRKKPGGGSPFERARVHAGDKVAKSERLYRQLCAIVPWHHCRWDSCRFRGELATFHSMRFTPISPPEHLSRGRS